MQIPAFSLMSIKMEREDTYTQAHTQIHAYPSPSPPYTERKRARREEYKGEG